MTENKKLNEFKRPPIKIIMQRTDIERVKNCDTIFEKNRVLCVKAEDSIWKVVVGDGITPLNQLPLQDSFTYNPNEKYIIGNNITLLSHTEKD